MATFHEPVMVDEVLHYLSPRTGTVIDATVGGGGHARAILDALAEHAASRAAGAGRLLGLDLHPEAIASAGRQLVSYGNMELVNRSYVDIPQVVRELGLGPVTGVLLDLGVSLHQLQESCRGFSHDRDGELDMRFDPRTGASAREVISRASEQQLREWLRNFGEEPMSGRIARVIHEARGRVRTTHDLVRLVRSVVPARLFRRSLPRVFQAFRIAVNAELEGVRAGLAAALEVLAPGGRAVVISYHSLEDRLAKQALRAAGDGVCVLTRKPVRPGVAEVERNPRARSARLRAAEVVA